VFPHPSGTTAHPDACASYARDFPRRDPELTTGASGHLPRFASRKPRREFQAAQGHGRAGVLPLDAARRRLNGEAGDRCLEDWPATVDSIECRRDPGVPADRTGSRSRLLSHPRRPFGRRRRRQPPEPPSSRGARGARAARSSSGGAPLQGGRRAAGASLRIATRTVRTQGPEAGASRRRYSAACHLGAARPKLTEALLSRRSEAEPKAGAGQGQVG